MSDWVVYIIKCNDNSLYTGITNNLERRISQHEDGIGAKYTRGRSPFELVHSESCKDRSEASKRELKIKAMTKAQKLSL